MKENKIEIAEAINGLEEWNTLLDNLQKKGWEIKNENNFDEFGDDNAIYTNAKHDGCYQLNYMWDYNPQLFQFSDVCFEKIPSATDKMEEMTNEIEKIALIKDLTLEELDDELAKVENWAMSVFDFEPELEESGAETHTSIACDWQREEHELDWAVVVEFKILAPVNIVKKALAEDNAGDLPVEIISVYGI